MLLSRRFALGLRLTLWLCRSALPRFTPDFAALSERFASVHACLCDFVAAHSLGACPVMRFYCGVLPRFTPVFFPLSGKKRRLAVSCVPIPPGRDRHSCVLVVLVRLSGTSGSLRACAFLYGDLDELPGDAENGERGWRRGLCASLRKRIGFVMLSAGRTLGLRAPNLR